MSFFIIHWELTVFSPEPGKSNSTRVAEYVIDEGFVKDSFWTAKTWQVELYSWDTESLNVEPHFPGTFKNSGIRVVVFKITKLYDYWRIQKNILRKIS